MQVILTNEESLQFFHESLCNGLQYMAGYGLKFTFDKDLYNRSRKNIPGEACFEDVLIQMLKDGYTLAFIDIEGKGAYNAVIRINDVYERVQKTPLPHLVDMVSKQDDAYTADAILQTVFFNEIIFG